jgi:hypothetical protein
MYVVKRVFQTPSHLPLLSRFRHKADGMSIPRDVQEFLDRYPRNGDDRRLSANLGFYSNYLRCRPDDLLVEEIHEQSVAGPDAPTPVFPNRIQGGMVTTTG